MSHRIFGGEPVDRSAPISMGFLSWESLLRLDAAVDRERVVCIVPLAATEQHGPHLPVTTDSDIAAGLMAETEAHLPPQLTVLAHPVVETGASREHERFPGLRSVSTPDLIVQVGALAADVADAGLRKLVLITSHGGNIAAMTAAALDARAAHDMLAVTTSWMRLGLPAGLVSDEERAIGVHGGLIETALMLHLRPDLVDMGRAKRFDSLQSRLSERFELLRAYGPVGFGWLAGDLNTAGVVGDASEANAATGRAIAAYQSERFARLIEEVAAADLRDILAG